MLFFRKNDERCSAAPSPGHIQFGDLGSLIPAGDRLSDRKGTSIYNYYTEQFLRANTGWMQGTVLEDGGIRYAKWYGSKKVLQIDALFLDRASVPAGKNIVTLKDADLISSHTYDCIILRQTLQYTYNIKDVLLTLYRILKQGGVLLATVPGISRNQKEDHHADRYWSFTTLSVKRLCEEVFPASLILVRSYGNVMTAMALIHGLKASELKGRQLDFHDPLYPVVVAVRAVKPL